MRLATIDIGTNTANLLITDVDADGRLHPLVEEKRFIRLGEGVDGNGRIGEAAIERLLGTLMAYKEQAETAGADTIIVGATSASRDAKNRDAIIERVYAETGLRYTILNGQAEARWTFAGAISAFPDLSEPCVVQDIGGGSTEIVLGDPTTGEIIYQQSFDVGTVRLTERLFPTQPPTPEAVAKARDLLHGTWRQIPVLIIPDTPFVGAAGTAIVLAMLDARPTDHVELTRDEITAWGKRLLSLTYEEVLALNPQVLHGRADLIGMGVLILESFMNHFGLPTCRVSPRELRHGLALRYLRHGARGEEHGGATAHQ